MPSSCQTLTLEPYLLYSQSDTNKLCTPGCHAEAQLFQSWKQVAMMHSGKEQGVSHFSSSPFHPMTWWQHRMIVRGVIQFRGKMFLLPAKAGLPIGYQSTPRLYFLAVSSEVEQPSVHPKKKKKKSLKYLYVHFLCPLKGLIFSFF